MELIIAISLIMLLSAFVFGLNSLDIYKSNAAVNKLYMDILHARAASQSYKIASVKFAHDGYTIITGNLIDTQKESVKLPENITLTYTHSETVFKNSRWSDGNTINIKTPHGSSTVSINAITPSIDLIKDE